MFRESLKDGRGRTHTRDSTDIAYLGLLVAFAENMERHHTTVLATALLLYRACNLGPLGGKGFVKGYLVNAM